MTNTDNELFELCEQVYEVTRWESDELHWMIGTGSPVPFVSLSPGKKQIVEETDYPIYTSDYLLEKLPQGVSVYKEQLAYAYNAGLPKVDRQVSDTPLKALLKLVIALDDSGVKL